MRGQVLECLKRVLHRPLLNEVVEGLGREADCPDPSFDDIEIVGDADACLPVAHRGSRNVQDLGKVRKAHLRLLRLSRGDQTLYGRPRLALPTHAGISTSDVLTVIYGWCRNSLMEGNQVAEHRKASGLTQIALANLVGVTDQTISNIERGESTPDVATALALAKALGVPVEVLFASESSTADVDATREIGAATGFLAPSRSIDADATARGRGAGNRNGRAS